MNKNKIQIVCLFVCFRNSSLCHLVPRESMVLPAEYSDEVSFNNLFSSTFPLFYCGVYFATKDCWPIKAVVQSPCQY